MTNREKVDYINTRLGVDDLLLALAEGASELSQAALKLHRKIYGKSPTLVTTEEATRHLIEEMDDTNLCGHVLAQCGRKKDTFPWEDFLSSIQLQKLDRWVKRLKDVEANEPPKEADHEQD